MCEFWNIPRLDQTGPLNTKHDRLENITWTDSEHQKAELGTTVESVRDLSELVIVLTSHYH